MLIKMTPSGNIMKYKRQFVLMFTARRRRETKPRSRSAGIGKTINYFR